MEFKGTKGKWNLKEFNDARLKFRFVLFSENGDNVCKILRDDNDNSEEEKANAKLIACAPEMLDILKETLQLQKEHVKSGCNTRFLNIEKLESIIKKATS